MIFKGGARVRGQGIGTENPCHLHHTASPNLLSWDISCFSNPLEGSRRGGFKTRPYPNSLVILPH